MGKECFYQDFKISNIFKLKKHFIFYPEEKQVYLYRKTQYYSKSKISFIRLYWKLKWLKVRKQGCQISLDAKIGSGLRLLHYGTRIIVGASVIGKNCTIGINVVVGYKIDRKTGKYSAPTIGDNVYIGHNSSIIGGVRIGDNVLIAPNSFINKDVPSNSIVVGNNHIIPSDNPSKVYIK